MTETTRYKHRSFSQVKQLRTCAYQYKLERVHGIKSRPSVPATAGTAVHVGTEIVDDQIIHGNTDRDNIVRFCSEAAIAALETDVADRAERSGWPVEAWKYYGRQTLDWFRETGIPNSIQAYTDWRLENDEFEIVDIPGHGPAIEVPFNYYISDQLIHGFIDRIFTSKTVGGYYPLDLKSGKKPTTDEQLGLYGAALHKALGWRVSWGYYLYDLKSGTAKLTAPLMVEHWNDEKLGQVYLPATQMIDLGLWIPNPGEACFHCGVSDHCQFVQSVV